MAVAWDNIKTILPNGSEVAYVFQNNVNQGGQCGPNPMNIGMQCTYLGGAGFYSVNNPDGNSWGPGLPLEGLFPNVGEYVTINVTQSNGNTYALCYKCLEIIDKNTFLTGTCTSCYDDGYGGKCSDVFITVPPYPGDGNGCRYDDSINAQGIVVSFFNGFAQGNSTFTSYISPDCSDCTTWTSGNPTPDPLNFVQNCCDPSEQYQFSPTSSIAQSINSVSSQSGVIVSNSNAFMADLYISPNGNQGAQTGMKCWSVGTNLSPQLIPFVYSIAQTGMVQNGVMVVFPNCQQLQNYTQLNPNMWQCCGTPPTEWCCLTGVAGPPTTCTQVALGTCNPAIISNYSAGPFQSQQLCLAAGCATVSDPPYECELPVAALINLQAKVKGFSDRRTQALSEPNADPALERAFKNTGTSTISPGTTIKSDSGGGTTDVSEGETNNPPPREGGGRPAPSNPNPYVDGGGY